MEVKAKLLKDEFELRKAVRKLKLEVAVDTETNGLGYHHKIRGISFADNESSGYYWQVEDDAKGIPIIPEAIKDMLREKEIIMHNAKFDVRMFKKAGVYNINLKHCTMVMLWVANTEVKSVSLKEACSMLLGIDLPNFSDLFDPAELDTLTGDRLENLVTYAVRDVCLTMLLKNHLWLNFPERSKQFYFNDVALAFVLSDMELLGFDLDLKFLEDIKEKDLLLIEELKKEIYDAVGYELNINSPDQLSNLLYNELKCEPQGSKNKKGNYSTSIKVIKNINHPLVKKIILYKEKTKEVNSFLEGFPKYVSQDNKLRTSYLIAHVPTFRFASGRLWGDKKLGEGINIQQVPKHLRKAFLPPKDYYFVAIDYKQQEFRILLSLTDNEKLKRMVNAGLDIHSVVASMVFDVPLENVTKDLRSKAKAVVFGLSYGMSKFGLANNLNISIKAAERLIGKFFSQVDGFKDAINKLKVSFLEKGYVEDVFGRIRHLQMDKENYGLTMRNAQNTPIQGSGATLMRFKLNEVYRYLKKENLYDKIIPAITIHDEVDFLVHRSIHPQEVWDRLAPVLRAEVRSIELDVDMSYGPNWGDLELFDSGSELKSYYDDFYFPCVVLRMNKLSQVQDFSTFLIPYLKDGELIVLGDARDVMLYIYYNGKVLEVGSFWEDALVEMHDSIFECTNYISLRYLNTEGQVEDLIKKIGGF